eukprot:3070466-Rhodomonas_salina.1
MPYTYRHRYTTVLVLPQGYCSTSSDREILRYQQAAMVVAVERERRAYEVKSLQSALALVPPKQYLNRAKSNTKKSQSPWSLVFDFAVYLCCSVRYERPSHSLALVPAYARPMRCLTVAVHVLACSAMSDCICLSAEYALSSTDIAYAEVGRSLCSPSPSPGSLRPYYTMSGTDLAHGSDPYFPMLLLRDVRYSLAYHARTA